MKRKLVPYLLGLFFVIAAGALLSQEPQAFTVPVPPPPEPSEDVLMYWNNPDGDEGPDVEWFGTAPAIAAAPLAHMGRGNRVFIRGESGPWLGVVLSDIDAAKAKELKLPGETGVLVKEVREDSPAAKAGLAKDDVIVEFDGEKIRSAAQLRRLVRETPVERNVTIVVNRAGQTKSLAVKLEARHHGPRAFAGVPVPPGEFNLPVPPPHARDQEFNVMIFRGARLGISGDDLTSQLAEFFGVKQGKGVLVREVIVGSAAEKGGLKAGDVIVAVDGKEVASVSKLRRALAGEKVEGEKRKVSLTIVRNKQEQTLTVELDVPDKVKPRHFMRAELDIDHEAMQDFAEEMAAQAKEIELEMRENAKELEEQQRHLQLEQKHLQEEMQQLQEELPKFEREINREMKGAAVELEKI
jgi:membrane-associated protease RseP (regulator of RpoE activity)